MQEPSQLSEFGKVFLFLLMGILFMLIAFAINKLISLNKPTPEKLISYECGEDPTGNSWLQFNSRFYVIALIFLLFDVEMAFIFPWATIFAQPELIQADIRWGWFSLVEMLVFVGILILGLAYVWIKGDLNWIQPEPIIPSVDPVVPPSYYEKINKEQYTTRPFVIALSNETDVTQTLSAAQPPKPTFKPVFRKTSS